MYDLTDLANKSDDLLLTEVAAFLHDWQKCIGQWKKLGAQFNPADISSVLDSFKPQDILTSLTYTENSSLKQLIEEGKDPSKAKHSSDWRIKLLGICHNIAHIDKPQVDQPQERGLGKPTCLIASVFGFETLLNEKSSELLKAVNNINQRNSFLKELEQVFNHAVGDTRRPLNEVRLWEWGAATAAFWKAIAARYIIENKVIEHDLKWRILSISFDGISFLERSLTIGDLLGRQTSLQASLNLVHTLLEETYPLGNEVYRDENGSAFLMPELEGDDIEGSQLRNLLENLILNTGWRSELSGELKPQIHITAAHEKGIVIHKALALSLPPITPFEDYSKRWWQGKVTDICTVCGMRPQGWGEDNKEQKLEAFLQNVCHVCLKRRGKRAQAWLKDLQSKDHDNTFSRNTIWIDEVADKNGHLALVVGRFNLNDWLNGDMIKTLIVVCNPSNNTNKNYSFSKEPSFARIQRVWRTTQRFWQESFVDAQLPMVKGRLNFTIDFYNFDKPLADLGNYDLVFGTTKLSILYYNEKLITTDNLCYVAKQLGAEYQQYSNSELAVTFVDQKLLNQQVFIEEPTGYGKPNQLRGSLTISNVQFDSTEYSPIIQILAEPRTFMALVPADKSLEVIKTIQTKYEREMGKVRNRLPLHLGIVYFHRRTPLRSALDAGRQMLSYKSPNHQKDWQVQSISRGELPKNKKELANGTQQFEETITLNLIQDNHTITWHIPAKMGDGTTDDVWYPYVFLETHGDDSKVSGRKRAIKSQRPGETTPCWLVHTDDLQEGDRIYFTPSTFDFEFLDSSARRFDIYYDENGRRPGHTRPFYLEDLDRLDQIWNILKNLETSQCHQIIYTIEATRETWYGQDEGNQSTQDQIFQQFVTDTLANANWPKSHLWSSISSEQRQKMIEAGVRGELADLAELHIEILKEQ